jgi:hypothetical protein
MGIYRFEQGLRKPWKLCIKFELHSRSEKSKTLKQTLNKGVLALLKFVQSAKTACDFGVLLRKLGSH